MPTVQRSAEVALVNPPFGSIFTPSIQLGLLKAVCARNGIEIDDIYLNVEFAVRMGLQSYNSTCWVYGPQLGEWLFGESAFPGEMSSESYIERFGSELDRMAAISGMRTADLLQLRKEVIPRFVMDAAAELAEYRVVGFSSTFQQNVAALALARATKEIRPDVVIILGGSNVHGVMGEAFFETFDYLDYVVTGEADHLIAPVLRDLLDGKRALGYEGVLSRESPAASKYPMYIGRMDDLPIPDYSTYFRLMEKKGLMAESLGYPLAIPFESSRGCWWGAKHHCTFCGLNPIGMTYRAKSPRRVVDEIEKLQGAYGLTRFDATDNIIAHDSEGTLLSELAKLPVQPDLFYEIKSNIGAGDAAHLAKAGIRRVQPGVESFSTRVLKLMNKGVTSLHNINAIRWMYVFGINALYNILYGFPDEDIEDYERQRELVLKIVHLPPPTGAGRIRLDRFSPNFENEGLRSKFKGVRPAESYCFVYPARLDIWRAAYHFEGVSQDAISSDDLRPFLAAVETWKHAWDRGKYFVPFQPHPKIRPVLEYSRRADGLGVVRDGRRDAAAPEDIVITGIGRTILEGLMFRPAPLADVLGVQNGSRYEVERELHELVSRDLVLVEGRLGLSLPVVNADADIVQEHLQGRDRRSRDASRVNLPVV